MPATAIGQNTQQSDSTKVKTEKMAMYPNLSMKGIFPMPTWFGYTSNWEAIGLQEAVAFSGNKNTGAFAVQVNRQMPCGFSVDLIFNQPIDGTGMANLWLAKKFFGDKLALGGAFSTAKPVSQAGWTIQANPIYTDKTLLTFGVQTNNIGGEATTKGAVEARREVGGGRIIGFGGYTVLTGEMMTEFGGSV
ncbi:MAG: hypothetical protein NT051_02925, partial [Candidatus Micrarchaeota archaeon]|nr:hypothetical protein [Candidatus Micrarchaeota archaeon]